MDLAAIQSNRPNLIITEPSADVQKFKEKLLGTKQMSPLTPENIARVAANLAASNGRKSESPDREFVRREIIVNPKNPSVKRVASQLINALDLAAPSTPLTGDRVQHTL
ncbi:MAG: hypothetical protein P4L16_05340 [Chlamydiales bacterium]|nr:hypothetical protein [Chlamydiales bacterium]